MRVSAWSFAGFVISIGFLTFNSFEIWGQSSFGPMDRDTCTSGFNKIPGTVVKKSEEPAGLRLAFTNSRAPSPTCQSSVDEKVVDRNKTWEVIDQCDEIEIIVNEHNIIIDIGLSDATPGPQAVVCP